MSFGKDTNDGKSALFVKGQWLFMFLVACCAGLLILLRSILMPFMLALTLSYLCEPLVRYFEAKKVKRWVTSLMLTVLMTGVIVFAAFVTIPFVIKRLLGIIWEIDFIKAQATMRNFIDSAVSGIWGMDTELSFIDDVFGYVFLQFGEKLKTFGPKALRSIMDACTGSLSLFFTPILLYHILKDWRKMIVAVTKLIPVRHTALVKSVFYDIDKGVSKYLHAQVKLCFVLGVLYSSFLFFTPLKMVFLFGFMIGIASIVPYFGFLFTMSATLIIAMHDTSSGHGGMLQVVVAIGLAQLIDVGYLTPKIMSDELNLSPAWLIFGVLAFTALFGFAGAFFALPMVVVVTVIIKRLVQIYKQTPMYYVG